TMPVMDGSAALAAIREDQPLRHIAVVAVTASTMLGDRTEIPANGFNGHVSKSVDRERLKHTTNEVLYGNR
ncbi:MAG: response regulator, partial [Bryobacteraceae bacterium]|nr:response regulator [Bryobacteraceae bacterium]